MKNLKKVLSLVLALAMALSLMTVAFAADASDFKDYSKVTYNEAVDVMVAAGVFNGKDGNKFAPNDTLTREEAAKIVTYMLLGQEDADKLTADIAPYADVAAGRWSAGAIAYCTNEGILTGSNGKFYPTGKLTGQAFAKMLLCALGYDAKIENLEGSSWAINSATLAIQSNLDDDMEEVSLSKVLTREEAAQMAFNTMKADLVRYANKGTNITLSDGSQVVIGASAAAKIENKKTSYKAADYTAGSLDETKNDGILQFCEKHCDDLQLTETGRDDFGRPATQWVFDSKKVGTYGTKDPVLTYTTTVKEKDIFSDLDADGISGAYAKYVVMDEIWADGVQVAKAKANSATDHVSDTSLSTRDAAYDNSVVIAKGDKSNTVGTGEGVTVEIYKTSAPNHYTMVVIHEYLAKVTSVTKADTNKDEGRKINLNVVGSANGSFETEEFAKGDYVLVTKAGSEIKSVKAAEKVENVAVTSYKSDSVTAGGTTYKYSQIADTIEGKGAYDMKSGSSYTFYLDSCGNIIKGEAYAATNDDYVYVVAVSGQPQGDATVETQYKNVKYIDMTGKASVAKVDAEKVPNLWAWYTMDEDSDNDGYMTFKAVPTTGDTKQLHAAATKLDKTQPNIATGILANADTVFVLNTAKDEYKTYTGISNVPGYTFSSRNATAVVKDGYAVAVYLDLQNATASSTGSDDLVYLLDTTADNTEYDATNKVYLKIYDAIVDGKMGSIKVAEGNVSGANLTAGLVKITAYDNNGYVKTVAAADSKDNDTSDGYAKQTVTKNGANTDNITYSDSTLKVANVAYLTTNDTVVYMIDSDDNLTVGTAEDLVGNAAGDLYIVYKSSTDSTVTAIYFDGTIA